MSIYVAARRECAKCTYGNTRATSETGVVIVFSMFMNRSSNKIIQKVSDFRKKQEPTDSRVSLIPTPTELRNEDHLQESIHLGVVLHACIQNINLLNILKIKKSSWHARSPSSTFLLQEGTHSYIPRQISMAFGPLICFWSTYIVAPPLYLYIFCYEKKLRTRLSQR